MADDVQLLALYLPQFHPVPENDRFWGEGFTEWTSTLAALPSFSDQRQPRLPGELGTYDLRDPAVVAQQEALARDYGIDAFVYYHYWFDGHRVMGGPLDDKRANPDHTLPFALCWANHDWNRNQNGLPPELLIEQRYSAEDDAAHTTFLAGVFADPRYLRWQGRPVFFMYRTQEHPDPVRFADQLRAASIAAGAGDPYLIRFETNGSDTLPPADHHFDAGADLHPHWLWHTPEAQRPRQLPVGRQGDFWMDYDAVAAASSARVRTGASPPGSTPAAATAASRAARVPPRRRINVLREIPASRAMAITGTSATSLPSVREARSAASTSSSSAAEGCSVGMADV